MKAEINEREVEFDITIRLTQSELKEIVESINLNGHPLWIQLVRCYYDVIPQDDMKLEDAGITYTNK